MKNLIKLITESPVLALPDIEDPNNSYELATDASSKAYGSVLTQEIDGERKIIAYYSKSVQGYKRAWSAAKLEFMAMYFSILHFRQYLQGTKFVLVSDCRSLTNFGTMFRDNSHIQRNIAELSKFDFSIRHIKGTDNVIPDFLSRYQADLSTDVCTCNCKCDSCNGADKHANDRSKSSNINESSNEQPASCEHATDDTVINCVEHLTVDLKPDTDNDQNIEIFRKKFFQPRYSSMIFETFD